MAFNERRGALPLANALEALPKLSGAQIPGIEIPRSQTTGSSREERLLLIADRLGATYLAGDPKVTSIRLTQIRVGGDIDTILEVRRREGATELILTQGGASAIKEKPGQSYSEAPSKPKRRALTGRILTNIAALQ